MQKFYLKLRQKTTSRLRQKLRVPELETGFSMLEAVVVVGVLLALAAGGFFAYGPITENAKKAKVKSTAAQVYTSAMAFHFDGDSATEPQDAIDNWNGSTDKIRVELLAPSSGEPLSGAMTTGGALPAAYVPIPGEDFCVSATNVESPHIHAGFGSCPASLNADGTESGSDGSTGGSGDGSTGGAGDGSAGTGGTGDGTSGTGDGTSGSGGTGDGTSGSGGGSTTPTVGSPGDTSHLPPSNTTEGYLVLKFDTSVEAQCSTITLPVEYVGVSTNSVNWGDGTVTNSPAWYTEHTYTEQGVRYVVIKGTVAKFGQRDWEDASCLLEVPTWTNASGTKDMSYAFHKTTRLTSVPRVPNTVEKLQGTFLDSTYNAPVSWTLPKLITTFEMFKNNKNFNQPVYFYPDAMQITYGMFEGATAMNSSVTLGGANNGQTLNNISNMFKDATSFNAPVNLGYADKVVTAAGMFENATAFNQPLTLSLSFTGNGSKMFKNATSFNSSISSMKFRTGADHTEMFMGATAFNQPVSSLTIKADGNPRLTSMFEGAVNFNQPLTGWNISGSMLLNRMFWNTPSFNQDLSGMQIHNTLYNSSTDFSDAPDRSWWPSGLEKTS